MMLKIAALTCLLFCALVASWRWLLRPWFVTGFFLGGSTLLLLWAPRLDLQAFTWIKVLTLAVSMQVILWLPRTVQPWQDRLSRAVVAILALNILEAVVADAGAGRWLNAVVGLSLIATLRGWRKVGVGSVGNRPAVRYDLPWCWLLAYTFWNLTVVCGHYPPHWLDHFAVLAVPLVVAATRDRRLWLEARAFSLGLYAFGVVLAIDAAGMPWIPDSPSPASLYPYWSAAATALAIWTVWQRIASRGLAPEVQ